MAEGVSWVGGEHAHRGWGGTVGQRTLIISERCSGVSVLPSASVSAARAWERRPSEWCRSVFPQLRDESSRRARGGLVRDCGLTPWLGKPCYNFLISNPWNAILGKKRRCTLPVRELSLVLVASPLRCVRYHAGDGVGRWLWVTDTPACKLLTQRCDLCLSHFIICKVNFKWNLDCSELYTKE